MEANKIAKNAKSLVLNNGIELTYCELGEENEEVMVTGAFYFHTIMPLMEELAKRFHVYGVVMRFDGHKTELNKDGSTNWSRDNGVMRFISSFKHWVLKNFITSASATVSIPAGT